MIDENKEEIKKSKRKIMKENFKFHEVISVIFVTLVIGIIIGYAVTANFKEESDINSDKALKEFIETYNDVKENYYEEVDSDTLINGAIGGMLGALDDPYTTYLDEYDTSDFNDRLNGSYSGVGVEITMDENDNVLIANVFDDSPASRAGLQKGDIFKKIGDTDVSEMNSNEISSLIKENTEKNISITVLRDNNEMTFNVELSTIELESVTSKIIDYNNNKVGYIDIDLFALNTYSQFKRHLESLEKDSINSLIIDVRSNTGGYLDVVTDMINLFLERDEVIYQIDEKGDVTKILDETKESRNYNIVVLTNEYSASASEILTAALQESYGAKVVGMNTYGKGTVQQTKGLEDTGGMLKYTVQKWLTPKGNWINDKGDNPPDLAPQNHRGIQRQILHVELGYKGYDNISQRVQNNNIIHQIVNRIASKFSFQLVQQVHVRFFLSSHGIPEPFPGPGAFRIRYKLILIIGEAVLFVNRHSFPGRGSAGDQHLVSLLEIVEIEIGVGVQNRPERHMVPAA